MPMMIQMFFLINQLDSLFLYVPFVCDVLMHVTLTIKAIAM